jgi:anion-transporting  ArsA/GET3 family ATPase
VVFNPDLLSLRETERLVRALADLNLPLSLLIDNKITGTNQSTADRVEARLRQMTDTRLKRVPLANDRSDGQERKLYEIGENLASWFPPPPS